MTPEDKPEIEELFRYTDVWYFAMLLSNGTVLGFETIYRETENFYVISLLDGDMTRFGTPFGKTMVGAECSRTTCHVSKSQVVAIMEFTDT